MKDIALVIGFDVSAYTSEMRIRRSLAKVLMIQPKSSPACVVRGSLHGDPVKIKAQSGAGAGMSFKHARRRRNPKASVSLRKAAVQQWDLKAAAGINYIHTHGSWDLSQLP